MNRLTSYLILTLLLTVVGCDKPIALPLEQAEPVDVIVSQYNANAKAAPRLWAYARVAITFREKPSDLGFTYGSASKLADPNARLLLAKPTDGLLLIKETGAEVARLGVSLADKVYYGWFLAGDKRACLYAPLGSEAQGGVLSVNPADIFSALGVLPLPDPSAKNPAGSFVTQRVITDPPAYLLTVSGPTARGLRAKRDIYFDRTGRMVDGQLIPNQIIPFRIDYFDSVGRCVLRATLSDYHTPSPEITHAAGITVTSYIPTLLHFRDELSGTEITIRLSGVTTEDKVDPDAYKFWDRLPAGLKGIARDISSLERMPAP